MFHGDLNLIQLATALPAITVGPVKPNAAIAADAGGFALALDALMPGIAAPPIPSPPQPGEVPVLLPMGQESAEGGKELPDAVPVLDGKAGEQAGSDAEQDDDAAAEDAPSPPFAWFAAAPAPAPAPEPGPEADAPLPIVRGDAGGTAPAHRENMLPPAVVAETGTVPDGKAKAERAAARAQQRDLAVEARHLGAEPDLDTARRDHAGELALRPDVSERHLSEAGLRQGEGGLIGAVVVGEDDGVLAGSDAETAQIGQGGTGHHHARLVIAGQSDQALARAGRQHDLPGPEGAVALANLVLAGLSPVVGDLLQRSEQVVVVIAEDIGPRQDLDVRQRRQRSEHLGMPGLVLRADQQAAADQGITFAKDDARPGFACGAGGREARGARTDHQHVAMRMHRLVMVRVGFGRGAAEAGGPADHRLVECLPEALRPHEGLVVEAGGERLAGQRIERHHVEGERGPAVLATADEPVMQLDLGRLAVRLAPRALA